LCIYSKFNTYYCKNRRIYEKDYHIFVRMDGCMSKMSMKSRGEEAVSVAHAMALRIDDMTFPTYRQQGILINRGASIKEMMCQCLSNAGDRLDGKSIPVLYSFREFGFFSVSGNLGTQMIQAVGWGMAAAYKNTDGIASAFTGECGQ